MDSSAPRETGPARVDLRAFDEAYDAVEPASTEEVPDGRYQVCVQHVELDHTRDGDPTLRWDLVVLSGPHARRHIFKNAVITQASLPLVKGDLKTLGLELPRFSELPEYLKDLEDLTLEVTKRAKGEYTNVYFRKRVEAADAESGNSEHVPF